MKKINSILLLFVIILFIILYFVSTFSNKKKFTYLHLVLFSNDPDYNCMYEITSNYYKKFTNVKTVYYTFSEDINDEYILVDDILYIKGTETYIPGITIKTIQSFEYFKNYPFDYLIRSNISTIVNFDVLNKDLHKKNVEYGGTVRKIDAVDEKNGIIDKTYFGVHYVLGTSIILSKNALYSLLSHKKYIHYDIIDDVSIGLLFKEHTSIKPQQIGVRSTDQSIKKNVTFYRNKTEDRNSDCVQMKKIIKKLQ
jgi:hypothetical protein